MDMNRAHFSKKDNCLISGADLCKFYDRPVEVSLNVGDTIDLEGESSFFLNESRVSSICQIISKCTQTDYRESETQTDPWDPPFKVTKVLNAPEVLSISNFSFGNGLPASPLEINYISELRKSTKLRAEVESPVDDEAFQKKKQIICDQVKKDWDYKLSILNEKQLKKLAAMKSSLIDDMKKHLSYKEKFLTNLWTHKMTEMGKQHSNLQQKLRKEIHHLESKMLPKESETLEAGDIFEKRFTSTKIKAPTSKGTEYMLSNFYLNNPAGLSSVKNWLESKTDDLRAKIPLPKTFRRSQREKLADQAFQNILEEKRSKLPPKIYQEDYVKEEPPAPSVKAEDLVEFFDLEEKKLDLVTVWQRVLRGLAQQKQMLELIECHKEGLSSILSPLYPGIADS